MDRLEILIHETLDNDVAGAPSSEGLLDRVRAADGARRRRLGALVGAAAVVVLIALGLALAPDTSHRHAPPRAAAPSPVPSRSPAAAPRVAHTQPVSYRGITVRVPSDVPVTTVPCNLPARHVLLTDPSVAYECPIARDNGTRHRQFSVTLNPWDSAQALASQRLATTPTSVDGFAARIRIGTVHGVRGFLGSLTMVRPGVSVAVSAPTRAAAARILHSVQVTPVDALGCSRNEPYPAVSAGFTGKGALVPQGPRDAVVCSYAGFGDSEPPLQLLRSQRVARHTAEKLADVLDELHPTNATDVGATTSSEAVTFRYADGSVRTIWVDHRDAVLATNGRTTVQDHRGVLERVMLRLP